MRLTVLHDGLSYQLDVDPNDTFEELRTALSELTGVPAARQKLLGVKGAARLPPTTPLSAMGLVDGQKLMLLGSASYSVPVTGRGSSVREQDDDNVTGTRDSPIRSPVAPRQTSYSSSDAGGAAAAPEPDPTMPPELLAIQSRVDQWQADVGQAVALAEQSVDHETLQRVQGLGLVGEKLQNDVDVIAERAQGASRQQCRSLTKAIQATIGRIDKMLLSLQDKTGEQLLT